MCGLDRRQSAGARMREQAGMFEYVTRYIAKPLRIRSVQIVRFMLEGPANRSFVKGRIRVGAGQAETNAEVEFQRDGQMQVD
jgi:hypothetical protein